MNETVQQNIIALAERISLSESLEGSVDPFDVLTRIDDSDFDNPISVIREVCGWIGESDEIDEDSPHLCADDLTDIYNADLLKWVGDSLLNAAFVEDAIEEYGYPGDFYLSIMYGQHRMYEQMFNLVLEVLEEIADDQIDEEE